MSFSKFAPSVGHQFRDRENDASQLHPHPSEDTFPAKIRHQLATDLHPDAGLLNQLFVLFFIFIS